MDRLTEEELKNGFARLQAVRGGIDYRAPDILACHAALEHEVDLALEMLLPRPEHIAKLSFGNKIRVLQAASDSGWADGVAAALTCFNDLRNCIAHNDKKAVRRAYGSLTKATATMMSVSTPSEYSIIAISNAIMAALLAVESAV
jgi:hypothetical protein